MATLLLSAVGTAVGGPIGGAIGAIIGQQVDQNILFKTSGREGPRLQELAVQTSSYGSQIPRIYGRMRVAGTVIWATDLKETRSREGGGKGRPGTTIYSYSACFAVALSSRRIKDIGRIWADGKVFRGAAGDFKTESRFVFHPGGEDQPVDGLMASAEATGGTPGYRGLALAVFEDMDLTEYGNRIPSLTFEVIADDGAVTIADIIADISRQRMAMQQGGDAVIGFAAGGEDGWIALRSLSDSIPLSYSSDAAAVDRIEVSPLAGEDGASVLHIGSDFIRTADNQDTAPPAKRTASITAAPKHLSVRYYDPARDYQSGIQSASRPGAGRTSLVREFPATIMADQARTIAESGLWLEYQGRSTLHVAVALDSRMYRPGRLVQCDGMEGLWRVRECEIGNGHVKLALMRTIPNRNLARTDTEHGRIVADTDLPAGLTRLILVDLPFAVDAPMAASASARLYAAAAGGAGWRNAQLFLSGPDGAPGTYIGQIPAPTVIGTVLGTPAFANPALIDRINHIDVELHHSAMTLAHANDSQLLSGRNVALIGREIIQFSNAVPQQDGRFRLSRLIRGLGGTEAEIGTHGADEDFALLDSRSMLEIGSGFYAPFAPTAVLALGRDDLVPVPATIASPGRALMPWSPVHPRWNVSDGGDLEISWTRRSRAGSIWSDHVEVPLAEEAEKYWIELSTADGSAAPFSFESAAPQVIVSAALIDQIRLGSVSIGVKIFQVGASARSAPLAFEISL